MKANWQKLGLLYCPAGEGRHPKLLSHAANPLPVQLEGNVYRIFFSGRDADNRSSVGAVDIDIVRRAVICEHEQPFFQHGPEGSFYADGVSIGNCYSVDGVQYMLFMGWQSPKADHWRGDIGRLIVRPDLTLELDADAPLMGSDMVDPISLSYPWEGLAVPFELGRAQAFSRPTVRRDGEGAYEMWFSYRSGSGEKYRIGHAVSQDGRSWALSLEDAGIDVSADGWDSEMIEYPFVFDHGGQRYMLYNGNGFGKSGFGLAVLTDA